MDFTEVEVMRLGLDRSNNSYVVILQEKDGDRLLPIWIGQAEAESIVIEMNNVKRARPLTHDLCKSLIVGLEGKLDQVQITKVEDRTYYAEMQITRGAKVVHIDARPSDSIAIALRFSAPIFAQDSLLSALLLEDSADQIDNAEQVLEINEEMTAEQLQEYLQNLRPEDFGKFSL